MDSHNGTLPVCPRCAHPGHLILGLLKTPPVCIDCAVDPTLTNPQENWPKDGVKVSGGGVFKGEIGPSRIIVQHPKYSVLEQEFGDVLMVYNTIIHKLPRRSGNTLNNHVAKFKMPIATTQPQKCNMQNLGWLNATNITQGETELAMTSKETNLSHNIHVHPINKAILASKPQTINLFNYKVDLSSLAVSEGHAKPLESFVEKSCLVQLLEKSNKKQVQKHPVSKVTNPRMLNDRMNLCNAHERNSRYNQEVEAMVRNDQTTVPGFRVNAKPPQRMHGTASLFRSEAVPINAQHASLTKAGNLAQHVRLPEGVTDCPCKATIQENAYHPEFHKSHEDELSKWHQNSDAETRSEFHYKLPTQKASPCSILPEADEQTTVKATNRIGRMAAQKNLMPAKTLPNQNMNDWHSNSIYHSEFVNPKQLPQQATSVERVQSPTEAMDSMYKMATEENQMEAAKLSNHEVDILYPCSIFSSNLADHKSPTTTPEQGKSTEDVTSMASSGVTTENWAEFTIPDNTNDIAEAESPQKLKSGTTTLAVDQQNCTDVRVNLKEQVTHNSEEILVQDKNTDRLKSAIEIERHKLRTLRAIIKQLKKLLTRPKCAEDVTDNEYRERSEISDHTHPRSMDTLLEDADCPNKESRILYASNSNDDKHCETKTETMMPQAIKRTLKMELCMGSKRLRDEVMVLTMSHIEEKKPNQEQKEQPDTMNIGTDELHGFEGSRLARGQPIKKIQSGPVEENAMTSQKAESLTNTHMTTKSGKVLLEKDIKCGANDWKLPTESNPLTEYIEDQKLSKEDTDPMIISKELKVEMFNMVPCQKEVEKPEEDLKQASKPLITSQHESFQASKPVYENQRTADQLEKAKESEVELRNEKSLRSTKPLIVAQGGNLGRKRACNETHSSESSKDDKPLSKTRFENQEFEIAAKKPKFGEQESSGRCCKIEMNEAQAAVQPLECKGTATRKCPEDVTKMAKATIVEKPIKRVGQTNIAKPESYSEKERNEEQINHTAPVYVAIQQNKAKTQTHKNQELHACTREVKSQKPISDGATNLAKARSVERQQNTSPSKSYKEGETPKQQITVQIQKVKSQSTISDEATNLAKAIRVEMQQNTSPSKSYKEGETPKQQITVIINNKRDPRTQSRRECSNENVHCNLHEATETPHNPNGPSTSDCGSPTNAAHDMKRFPTLNFVQMQTAAMPQGEDKRTRHPSKEVATTNSDYTASRTSVDESIQDEDVQLKKPCSSSSQVKLNENKTEMPRLQNQERETEMKSDNDQGKTHGTIEPQGTPQDSKMMSTSDCVMSRTRVACERERSPDQKSISYCAQNQHGNNAVADHCKGDKIPPPTITQKPCKYHYLQKEWNPKSYPDFNALSTGGTFCSNIPQDSKGLGDQEKEISVDDGFGKEQRTRLHPASERLFIPDGAMPRNPAYEKEMHSRQQSPLQYMSKPSAHVQNQDNQSDARNNNHKALSLPSETHDGREFAILSLWGFDKQRIKDPRILSRMERELKSALTNMLLVRMSSLETLSRVQEPLEKGEIKDEQVLSDIEMHVFDKKFTKIELNPREVNIRKWSKIVIKTVRSDCPRTDVIEAKNVNWEQMTNISTGGANTHLIFKEMRPRKSKMRKFICLKRVMYWNNTLEISIYAHTFGQWLCVTHDSATSQKSKYFFANVAHGSAEKVTRKDDDGEFEGRNEGESSEAVKSHEVANIEKHCDLPQRYRGQYSNEADESARSGKEHWDRKRTKSRKRHARKGIYGEKVSPDSPR